MRAYIPPEVFKRLTGEQKQMWQAGTVARLLVSTGIPYIGPETIPLIVYRINMLQQSDAICKVAQGMPAAEIEGAAIVTVDMLRPFHNAVVDGKPFQMKSDEEFVAHMHHKLAQFMLPKDRLMEWNMKASELLKHADEGLQE